MRDCKKEFDLSEILHLSDVSKCINALFAGFIMLFLTVHCAWSQDTFTYNSATGNWDTGANWTIVRDGDNAGTSAYPGQTAGSADGADIVIIPTGDAVTLNLSPANSIGSLSITSTGSLAMATFTLTTVVGTNTTGNVSGTGTITISTGTLNVGNTISVTTLTCSGAASISVAGNWSVSTFTRSTSTVTFNGTSAQAITVATTGATARFNNLVVSKTGTLTVNSSNSQRIAGTFTISSGTYDLNGNTLTADGNVIVNGGTLSLSSGTKTLTGDLTYTSGALNLGSGTITISGSGDNSKISIQAGSFDAQTSTINNQKLSSSSDPVNNFFTIEADRDISLNNLTLNSASFDGMGFRLLGLGGSNRTFTINGTFDIVSYDVDNNGPAQPLTLGTNALLAYGSSGTVKYNRGTGITVTDEWSVTVPNVIIQQGTTTIATGTKTVGTQLTIVNGSLTIGGTLAYSSGATLAYSPSPAANVSTGPEWTSSLTPENVTITDNGFTVTLPNANLSVTNNLNIAGGNLASGNASNTLSVGGNVTTGTLTTAGSFQVGTLVMVGNQTQNITGGAGTIANLRINKTNSTDVVSVQSNTLTIASGGLLDVQKGNLVMAAGAVNLDVSGATFRIQSNGTYKTGGKTVFINGSTTIDFQTGSTYEFNGNNSTESFLTGAAATTNYGNVIINNTNSSPSVTVPSGKSVVIKNNLTLTSGVIQSGTTNSAGDIEVDGTASSSSSTSFVNGPLRILYPSGAASRDYPIGFGANYRPGTFAYTANSVATSIIEIEVLSGDPTGNTPSGIAQIATSHYYTVKEVGTGGTFTYDITLTTTGTGFIPVSRNKILIQNGATPDYSFPTQGTASGSTQSVSGLTVLPTDAFKVAFGAGGAIKRWIGTSGNWSVAGNWENSALPLTGDEILLDNSLQASAYTVTYNTSTSAIAFAKITISATAGVTLQLDKSTTIDLTDATTALDISDNANSKLIYNGTSIGMAGGGYDAAKTSIGASSTVEYRSGTVYADAYGNLTVNTSGTLSSTGATTVAGNYTKQNSGSHTMSNANMNVTGTSTISGGTLGVSGTGSLTLGTVSNSGTIDFGGSASNSLGSYSGSGTITAGGAGSITFSSNVDFGGNATFGSQSLTFQGNVSVTGGALTLSSNSSFTGNSKDFGISGGSVITSSGTLSFQTGTGQTVSGAVTFPSLTINNSNGITITSGSLPTVTGTLTLTDGLINFANGADYLTLNSTASISGGSSSSYVNGKARKIYATGSNVSGVFPVGKPTGRYQPVTILVGTVTGAGQYITVEQIETNIVPPLTTGINFPLVAVSRIRYWNVAYTASGGSMTSPTIRLSWDNNGSAGIADGVAGIVGSSTSADVVIARQSNGTGNWSNLGQSAFTGTYAIGPNTNTGTVTSSTFALTDGNADFVTFGALNSDVSLPVELTLFEAAELDNVGYVKLIWRTESEIENAYWFVQKKTPNTDFVTIATIDGQGSKTSSTDYQYVDTDVKPGDSVSYRLADIAYNGDITYHWEKSLRLKVPERFELLANYPNPFNPSTTISYKLPKQSRVQLTIYNVLGQKVRELVRGELQDAGVQRISWDSRNDAGSTVSTGIYIYRLQIGNFNTSRKMILMK